MFGIDNIGQTFEVVSPDESYRSSTFWQNKKNKRYGSFMAWIMTAYIM